jgi:hypothetical protein
MADARGVLLTTPADRRQDALASRQMLVITVCGAVILGVALRATAGPDLPLWVDESWTGGIAGQESLGKVVRLTLLDPNGPFYYLLMHVWSLLFGLSDRALRFPSFVFGALAPLLALIPAKAIGRKTCLIWCGLLALWIPAIWYSQEARCYSLLLFFATACMVAYARLLAKPDTRRAAIWTCLGSLTILTQFHALLLIALQGIAYIAIHRGRAIKTWPALLAFLPVFAWIALQLPRIQQFARTDATWFSRLTVADVPDIVNFVAGDIGLLAVLALIIAMPTFLRRRGPDAAATGDSSVSLLFPGALIGTAALAAAFLIVLGMMRPSFTTRYLMPFMPGILLGFAWAISQSGRHWAPAPAVILLAAGAASVATFETSRPGNKVYNFEAASHALMASGAGRLVFLWDNPLTRAAAPAQLDAMGGFFFRRQGKAVTVDPVFLRPGDDPNARVVSAAKTPDSAILWLYDLNVRTTAARKFPRRIEQRDPTWRCTDFGRGHFGVVACYRSEVKSRKQP